jgi:hypothetical protein
LAFIQNCNMDDRQNKFKSEVEEYHEGFFRGTFSTDGELKELSRRPLGFDRAQVITTQSFS